MKNTGEATETNNLDSGVLSSPLSFVRGGRLNWSIGEITYRDTAGDYWTLHSRADVASSGLDHFDRNLNPTTFIQHGYGNAVRGVAIVKLFIEVVSGCA